ncbi:MAG: InlB B-repeat-containing protein, partial [Dehalococcoidia bacterium]
MNTILGLWNHHYLRTVGSLLIAAVLIVALVSCTPTPPVEYDLTIGSSAGGQVTAPGEGTYTCDDGDVVDLVATPDCGYAFDGWTGDTADIADVNAASTNITMNADYDINANFKAIPADHFKFYNVDYETAPLIQKEVELEDQFGTFTANVTEAISFGNPVEKEHAGLTPIYDPDRHYTAYLLDYNWEEDWVMRSVEVSNQFQDKVELTVYGPVALVVPTQKEDHEMVECLNHYLVYFVDEADYDEFTPVEGVNLKDQFIPNGEDVTVNGPMLFANPVKKTVLENGDVSEIEDPELHYVLYDIWDEAAPSIDKSIQIDNQFGQQVLDLTDRDVLAVPSVKNVPPTPPLDHFKGYTTLVQPPLEWPVTLYDQFHADYFEGLVMEPTMFCNPVDKVHGTVEITSNSDNHLTVYKISAVENWYTVTVDNQFGNSQELTVYGPVALAVPTQKVDPGNHARPKYLDHYLLYAVWEPMPVDVTVDLDDQFPEVATGVTVGSPLY